MATFLIETDLSVQKVIIINVNRLAEMASQHEHDQVDQALNKQPTLFPEEYGFSPRSKSARKDRHRMPDPHL
jgi:hypothetical protein